MTYIELGIMLGLTGIITFLLGVWGGVLLVVKSQHYERMKTIMEKMEELINEKEWELINKK